MEATEVQNDRLRPVHQDDLARLLEWRNHPSIRRYMYSRDEITPEQHQEWFEQSENHPDKHLFIVESDSGPLGFVQFTMIRAEPVFDWGFYVIPGSPAGSGRRLGSAALHHAFSQLGAHKVCGQAISDNSASLRFHDAMGFEREGRLREQYFDGSRYHDVVCFGLLKSEWATSQ